MEGSAAVAPAAADADGQVQAPPAAAPLAAEQPQVPPAPEAPDPNSPEADVRAQLQAMQAEVEKLRGQLGQQGEQAPTPDDFFNELAGEDGDLGFTPEELAALQAGQDPNQTDPGQQEAQLKELDSYVNERIQQALDPIVQERQMDQLEAFVGDHPDLLENKELRESVVATMRGLAGRWGEGAEKDPGLLRLAYTHAKAESADAGAVPAEQAGASGASLETGAGQTQPGEDSEAEQYRKALLSGAGDNPFA